MSDVRITGLTIRDKATKKDGKILLCYFDADLPFVTLLGCALFRFKNGSFFVAPPSIEGPLGQRCAVLFNDDEMRFDIRDAAIEAYERMTGKKADRPMEFGAPVALPSMGEAA